MGEIDGWGQGNSKRHRDKERVGSNEEPDGYEVLVKCHMHIVYMYNCTCTKYSVCTGSFTISSEVNKYFVNAI